MKQIVVPLCVFATVASLFFGMVLMAEAMPNLSPAYGKLCDGFTESWCVEPGKYVYRHAGDARVNVTVSNRTGEPCTFDMGDGKTVSVEPYAAADYTYSVTLQGSLKPPQLYTYKYILRKIADEQVQCALVFKIEPEKKGGDTR